MRDYFEISNFRGIEVEDCFEIILSYCTMGEILACRQVSKSWKRVIDAFPLAWWNKALTRMIETNKVFFGDGRWHYSDYWKYIYDYLLKERSKTKIIKFSTLVSTNLQKEDKALDLEDFVILRRSIEFEVIEVFIDVHKISGTK